LPSDGNLIDAQTQAASISEAPDVFLPIAGG